MNNDPVAKVRNAIARRAAGEDVNLDSLRHDFERLAVLAHPGMRHDGPPRLDGLDANDPFAVLHIVLDVLEAEGPDAATARLNAYYPEGRE